MDTNIIKIDSKNIDKSSIEIAAEVIKNGGLVAFPTETVYGLGANTFNEDGVKKIFIAKGRPSDNPLISHIYNISQLNDLAIVIPDFTEKLTSQFWPGPLTLIFKKNPNVPDIVTAGLDTVAVRMPSHPVALALLEATGVPIAAPSANISGRPSPTCSRDVIDDLNGKVDVIIDSDKSEIGVESTVLDISGIAPIILRPGAITLKQISKAIGKEVSYNKNKDNNEDIIPQSPGMKYKHYSPNAHLILITGDINNISKIVIETAKKNQSKGKIVGILSTTQTNLFYTSFDQVICLGDREKPETISSSLFTSLRDMDKLGVDVIIAEGIVEEGLGIAIMNRLRKASDNILDSTTSLKSATELKIRII